LVVVDAALTFLLGFFVTGQYVWVSAKVRWDHAEMSVALIEYVILKAQYYTSFLLKFAWTQTYPPGRQFYKAPYDTEFFYVFRFQTEMVFIIELSSAISYRH